MQPADSECTIKRVDVGALLHERSFHVKQAHLPTVLQSGLHVLYIQLRTICTNQPIRDPMLAIPLHQGLDHQLHTPHGRVLTNVPDPEAAWGLSCICAPGAHDTCAAG